eukprot:342904_1
MAAFPSLSFMCIVAITCGQNGIIFTDDFNDLSQWSIQRQYGSYISAQDAAPSWCTSCDGGVVLLRAAGSSWYDSIRTANIDTSAYSGPFYININFHMYYNQWGYFTVKARCEALSSYTTMSQYHGEYISPDTSTLQQTYLNQVIPIDPLCTGSSYIGLELHVYTSSTSESTYVDSIKLCSGYDVGLCGTFDPTLAPTSPTTMPPTLPSSSPTNAPTAAPTTPIHGVIFYDEFVNLDRWSILRQSGTYIYLADAIPSWCEDCNGTVVLRAGPSSWYDSIVTGTIDIAAYKPPFVININFYLSDYQSAYFYINIRCEGYGYTTVAQWRNTTVPAYTQREYLDQMVEVGSFCDDSTWIGIQLKAYTGSTQQSAYVDNIKLCAGYGEDLCGTIPTPTAFPTDAPITNPPSMRTDAPTLDPSAPPSMPSETPTTGPTMWSTVAAETESIDGRSGYTKVSILSFLITLQDHQATMEHKTDAHLEVLGTHANAEDT